MQLIDYLRIGLTLIQALIDVLEGMRKKEHNHPK